MPSTITFTGICDFTRTGSPGVVTVRFPDCSHPPYPYLKVHIPFLKVARNQIGSGSTFTGDSGLGNATFAVAAVTGQLVLEGSFAPGQCQSNAMISTAVPDMRNLSGYSSPTGPGVASIALSTGTLSPTVLNPAIHWNYGTKGSSAPTSGYGLAAEHVLALTVQGGSPFLRITSGKGILLFTDPLNAAATIGCLEVPDILSQGPYQAKPADVDFLFHHSFAGGIDDRVNLIPLLTQKSKRKKEGKRVDCFATRWF